MGSRGRIMRLGKNCSQRVGHESLNKLKPVASSGSLKIYASPSIPNPSPPLFDALKTSKIAVLNKNNIFFIDKLKLVRSLEAQGVPTKAAKGITIALSEFMNSCNSESTAKMLEMQQAEISRQADVIKNARSEAQNSVNDIFEELENGIEELRTTNEKASNQMRNMMKKPNGTDSIHTKTASGRLQKWKWRKEPVSWKAVKQDAQLMISVLAGLYSKAKKPKCKSSCTKI